MECKRIPWKEMFVYGVQVYKISPKDFWEMTMKEFLCLTLLLSDGNVAITKQDLEYMIKHFN